MRHAAYNVGATVPLEHSVEALECKLLGLRAEIDAILAQLGSEKVAAPAIETQPTPDMQSPEATTEVLELALDLSTPTQTEMTPEPSPSADEIVQPTTAIPIDAVASDPPSAVVPTPQGAPEPQGNEPVTSDDVTAIAAIEAAAAIADAPVLATEEAAAPQVEMSTAPASSPTALDEPIGATACERAAADVPAATTVHTRLAQRRSSPWNRASAGKKLARPSSRHRLVRAGGWQPRSPPPSLPCLWRQRCW